MMHLLFRCFIGTISTVVHAWSEHDSSHSNTPPLVLLHGSLGSIGVTIYDETTLCGEAQKEEHVATRYCGDECLFGIHVFSHAKWQRNGMWRRRRLDPSSTIEAPGVSARIPTIDKASIFRSLPLDCRFELSHAGPLKAIHPAEILALRPFQRAFRG